jgi:hypothetical protein
MGNEKIIARIKALRALATSSNVHEAAAAAAQATRLLLEHDLAEADVDAASGEPVEAPTIADEPLDNYGARVSGWKSTLAIFLTKAHGCAGWMRRPKDGPTAGEWTQVIVGRRGDVATSTRGSRARSRASRRRRGEATGARGSMRSTWAPWWASKSRCGRPRPR